jgi:hypothetical protein
MPFSDHRHEFTPEAIRKRMTQHMLHLWGVKSLSSIDPFARLVMETLASELNKISHELLAAEAGLLSRLAGLLTPDLLTVPRPAHAVVWVQPADAVAYMAPTESLFFTKRVASKPYGELDTRRDIFLSAVDTVKLLHGRVAWLAAGTALYKTDEDGDKQLAHRTDQKHKLPPHSLWLGLEMHPELTSLDRLGLYFELPHVAEPEPLFDLLQLGYWSLNGQPLDAQPGLCYDPAPGHQLPRADAPSQLLADTSLDRLLEQDVKTTYQNRFVHLRQAEQPDLAAQATPYPALFADYFAAPVLEELAAQPLLWLHVTLPANFSEDVLARLNVRLNALPVMNRRLHRLTYRTRVMHNILPLPVDVRETFLAVRSLIDSRNRVFTPFPLREAERLDTGHYTVRRSGIERFDARDAQEQLRHLLEVLRDEAVAFSAYGYDTVQIEAQHFSQRVNNLERLLTNQNGAVRELPHYLLVSPHEEFDTLEVSYWTTDCEDANNLHVGTELQPYDITYLSGHQPVLLTTTSGGQNRLRAANQLDAYRYALLSHDRIVTNEDIRAFMKAELGPLLSQVTISKGVMVGTPAKQGFVRTIDINLTPAESALLSQEEWESLCDGLKSKLVSRSAQVSQYRLFVSPA